MVYALGSVYTDPTLKPGPTWPNIFPIVHDRDKFSSREQSE